MSGAVKAPKIIVHHLNDSRSQRILWLLEELGLSYEIQEFFRTPELTAPDELKAIHPLGKAPIITDGDVVLAESGAIVEYLIDKYGPQFKPSEANKVTNLYWTHYAEGSLMPILVNQLIFTIVPERAPFFLRPLLWLVFGQLRAKLTEPRLRENAAWIVSHLEKTPGEWFAGDDHPTSADFMMVFALEAWSSRGVDYLPKLKQYVEKIHARPAYKRGLERGGKYAYA
ncbi:thioredoxin-like protein [Sistotremastrum niveocremeum HHB9708]|uniref:glutathione transferase n=2 Tax=Sistotremastraceae TaxID=3402574 RepID=A0A164YMM6_9AGAM|nr:thioredoxin-like protein [Sistotremastrum niveocremeum HHB9708]KZT36729.1 thioredoxin-like protein [Sistotremastrum suecicum HHB10207 ss-3]